MLEALNRYQGTASQCIADKSLWIVQLSHDNGGDLAAVIGLPALCRAPIGKEYRFVRVRTGGGVNDTSNLGIGEFAEHKARQVEMSFAVWPGSRQETAVGRFDKQQFSLEIGTDLVCGLIDTRTERGGNSCTLRTLAHHL